MHRVFLCLCALWASPGIAAEVDVAGQLAAANRIFTVNSADMDDYVAGAHARLLDGIEGTWFELAALTPQTWTEQDFREVCSHLAVEVTVRDIHTIDFVQRYGQGDSFTTTYSSRGGTAFGSYTDVPALLRRLGLDAYEAPPRAVSNVLNSVNGIATIFRPSPDTIVVQTNYSMPKIYGRCPQD